MIKRLCVLLVIIILLVAAGCSSGNNNVTTTTTQPAGIKEVRQAEIARTWTMKQLEINLESRTSILLKLKPGSEVSGYYYLTRGTNVDFRISGESVIYQSQPVTASSNITSDRFSFKFSNEQGITYTLEFIPDEKGTGKKVIPDVFLEVIYPVSGEIFVPMETK